MIRSESYPLLKLSLFTHIIDARKQSKLKFKSVVCKQSKQPVFRHLNASFVITDIADSQIAERTSPLPRLEFGRQRKKTVLVRIHSGVIIILRPRGMWLNPQISSPPISAQYLPVSLVTCDSTRLVFCSHSHLQEQHFIDSLPVQGKTWALPSI